MADGEPDFGVSGDNMDLGRFFDLFIRGQQSTNRVLGDLRNQAQQSMHMAQTFSMGPGIAAQAAQARQNMGNGPAPGMTTSQNGRVWTVTGNGAVSPPPPGAGQNVISGTVLPPGPPAGSTTSSGSGGPHVTWGTSGSPTPGMTTLRNLYNNQTNLPNTGAGWGTTFSNLAQDTYRDTTRQLSRAALGVWSPYHGQNSGGGSGGGGGGGGGQNSGGGGGGGQLGSGPYGMGPSGLPPNPIYFGGNGSPLGPYGPYGPYGSAGNGPNGGGPTSPGTGGGGGNSSGGGGGGVLGWIGSHVPGAGLVTKGLGEMRNQRDKNGYYQNVEGGGNFSGFGERAHEEAYVATSGAMFSGSEARTAFKGVTRLGYNGRVNDAYSSQGGRQDALDFAYHAKSSYGASVGESLKTLEQASKTPTINLTQLNKALKDLSDTAGRAGVNTQMARSQMLTLMNTGVQAGYGAGAVPTAANIQMGKTSLGRGFEDVDLSGQMSQQYTYMASSNAGMTYNQYTALQTTSPLAASQARAGENLSLLSQIFSQDEVNWVKQQADALGGQLDPNAALSIVPQFLQAFPNHNISIIQQQLSSFGIVTTSDPQQALAYAFNLIAGNNGDLANAQKNNASMQPLSASAAKKASSNSDSGLIKGFSTKVDNGSSSAANAVGFGISAVTVGITNAGVGGDKGDSSAMKSYKKLVSSNKGTRDPVIENLLQSVKDPDKAQVAVHTADGQRVMSLSDAIKSHTDELSSGEATFVSGSEKGKTVQDILGTGGVDPSSSWTSEAAKSSGKTGTSMDDWKKKHKSDYDSIFGSGSSTGSNGTVVVDLSDAAKQLLKISSTTGIAGANGEGAPPTNSYNWNATR